MSSDSPSSDSSTTHSPRVPPTPIETQPSASTEQPRAPSVSIQDPIEVYEKVVREEHKDCFQRIQYRVIWTHPEDDNRIKLHITGLHDHDMNQLRKILLTQVPSMGVYKVIIHENKSVLSLQALKERLCNIPIRADVRRFKTLKECDYQDTPETSVSFRLDVHIPLFDEPKTKTRWVPRTVYSSDLVLQSKHDPQVVMPIRPDIPIVDLVPGDQVSATLIYTKSCAQEAKKDPTRWIPGALLNPTLMPSIQISKKMPRSEKKDLVRACPKRVFEMDMEDLDSIVVARPYDCTDCGECTTYFGSYVQVSKESSSWRWEIESHGIYRPLDWFEYALKIAQNVERDSAPPPAQILTGFPGDIVLRPQYLKKRLRLSISKTSRLWHQSMAIHFKNLSKEAEKMAQEDFKDAQKKTRQDSESSGSATSGSASASASASASVTLNHMFKALLVYWTQCIVRELMECHMIPETQSKGLTDKIHSYYHTILSQMPTCATAHDQLMQWIQYLCELHLPRAPLSKYEARIDAGSLFMLESTDGTSSVSLSASDGASTGIKSTSDEKGEDWIDQEKERLKDKVKTSMYSPVSGSIMTEKFLTGFVASEVLIKYSDAAVKSCAGNGTKNVVTRQPMGSSATGGASRLGKMEFDAIKQHASKEVLQSILQDTDIYSFHCCILHGRLETKKGICDKCQNGTNVRLVSVPYSLILAADEMIFLNMYVEFVLADKEGEGTPSETFSSSRTVRRPISSVSPD